MTALLEFKQRIKGLYGKYEVYLLPLMKFVLALVYFIWINMNMGYMKALDNIFVVLILSLICSILPAGMLIFAGFAMMVGHCYALGIDVAAFMLVLILFILWVLSSWFPVLNITVVGIVGFAFLFLPKIEILSWREFTDTVSWSSFFLVGTMMTLGGALTENGVSHWLVGLLFQSAPDAMPVWLITLVISLVVFVLLIPIPIGPALISMLGAPFLEMAEVWGVSPVCLIMPLILCASNCYLLPLDTVPLLTYGTGYYKMTDMPRVSVAIQLFLALCLAIWLPISLGLIGS